MVNEGLRPGLFFSNSNIVPFDEYVKRRDELARYAFGLADGMDALARAVGVSLEKDVRGRWRARPMKGGAGGHGRP